MRKSGVRSGIGGLLAGDEVVEDEGLRPRASRVDVEPAELGRDVAPGEREAGEERVGEDDLLTPVGTLDDVGPAFDDRRPLAERRRRRELEELEDEADLERVATEERQAGELPTRLGETREPVV